jgi:hypothetical protein
MDSGAQQHARSGKGEPMKPRMLADFMFTGVAIVPAVCLWWGGIGYALFAFVALLIAACMCGWREQIDGSGESGPDDIGGMH